MIATPNLTARLARNQEVQEGTPLAQKTFSSLDWETTRMIRMTRKATTKEPRVGIFPSWRKKQRKKDGDVDDAWGAAREKAVAAKAREEDKKKREEKLKADAEQQKLQNLAEAVAHGEEIKAQRQAEEEEEARQQEENERKAEEDRKKAIEDAKRQVQSVEQTVDFDAERDLMKQLEQNYLEKDIGGASPSSDFGF